MKKLLFLFVLVFFVSCDLDEVNHAKLIDYEYPIVLDKIYRDMIRPTRTEYYFVMYQDMKLHYVLVDYDIWKKYNVRDTLHSFMIVPTN